MTNRKNIFIAFFTVIFSLSTILMSAFQYKAQNQINYISIILLAAILAFIGSAVAAGVLPTIPNLETSTSKIILIPLRISLVAILVVFIGGGLAFTGLVSVGRLLVAGGSIVGLISMVFISRLLFSGNSKKYNISQWGQVLFLADRYEM
jgi:membrane associated rhomboid family serine protease